jgi:hypothetical protein
MHDTESELPRISIPRRWVNKGKGRSLEEHRPFEVGALSCGTSRADGFRTASVHHSCPHHKNATL